MDTVKQESMEQVIQDVVVIGGGPAGASAALYAARAGLKTLVIDKGLTTGALGVTNRIANYPGLTEEISGAELLTRMREQARSFGAVFANDKIIGVDLLPEEKTIYGNQDSYRGRVVIIATGSMGRGAKIKGEAELVGRGVSYCATCDAAFFRDQAVLVAGSSDEALEEALYLTRFANRVYLISPTDDLRAPAELIADLLANPKVTLYKEAKLKEIIGEENVQAARFKPKGEDEKVVSVSGAFIYLQGGHPITDFLDGQVEITATGCVAVDKEFRTTAPGVFAVGDVLCNHIKQVVIAAGEGALAGMAADKVLRGRRQIVVDWAK